jgi:hypothetical protein
MDEGALAAELSHRHGVTSTRRLAALGIGKRSVAALVRQGRLASASRGVLVSTCWPDTLDRRMAVACAITNGVIAFPAAGLVWSLRKTPRADVIDVCVAGDRRVRAAPGVRIHRTRCLPDADIVARPDGVRVMSPPRTAADAARMLSVTDLESLVEHGIDLGYFTFSTFRRVAEPLCGKGWHGSGRLRAVLAAREPWKRPVRSDHELRLERAMRRRGFPPLTREHRLELSSGEVIHPDLGIPSDGFYVEMDHLTWHNRRAQSAYDRQRDLRARADGYHIERVSDLALDSDLGGTIEDLWKVWQRILRSRRDLSGT